MSRVKKRWYRVLSILCAAIFTLTSVPQTGMTALASEEGTKQEEIQSEAKRSAEENATVSGSDEATPGELSVSDNDDVLLGQDEIPEKNTSFKAASVSDGNTPAEQDKVTFSFQIVGNATIQNDSGETITSLETVKGSTEELTFQVAVSDGYVIKSVRPEPKGMIYVKPISSDMPGKYKITPARKAGGYQGNVTIIVTIVPLADYQATFVCPEGAELQVFKDDTAVTPENGVITLSNSEYLSFKVKPAEGLTPRVTYTSASDEMAYVLEESEVDAEGYYVYNYGKIFENHVFSIEVNETYQITFHSNYGGYYIQGVDLYKSDETMDSYDLYTEVGECLYDGSVTRVIKGQPYYFYLAEGPMCYDSRLVTTTGDESGRLTAFTYIDDMSIYKVTPTEDTDLTVLFEPHTISVIKDADVLETFTIEAQEEYQSYVTIAQDQSSVGIFDWTPLQVTYKPKAGMEMMAYTYSKSWVEDIEDENGNIIDQRYEYYRSDMDVTQNADGSYSFSVTADSDLLEITVAPVCTVSVETSHVTLYDTDGYAVQGAVKLEKNKPFTFRAVAEDGYKISYITIDGKESGRITPEEKNGFDWYTVTVTEDMTITAVSEENQQCQVTFQADSKLTLKGIKASFTDGSPLYEETGALSGTVEAWKSVPMYFAVVNNTQGSVRAAAAGAELTPCGKSDYGNDVYKLVPTENVTVTLNCDPYTLRINCEENVMETFQVAFEEGYSGSAVISEDQTTVSLLEEVLLNFTYKPKDGKTIKVYGFYTENSEDEFGNIITNQYNEEIKVTQNVDNGTYSFSVRADNTLQEIRIVSLCKVTFQVPSYVQIEGENGEILNGTGGWSVQTAKNMPYTFRVILDEEFNLSYNLSYVTTTGDESGKLTGKTFEGDVWYTVTPSEDMTITVVATENVRKKLTMVNQAENMQYEVAVSVQVTKAEDADNTYWISADAQRFDFTVTVEDKAKAPRAVLRNDAGEIELKGVKEADSDGRITYAFSLEVKDFSNEMEVRITSQAAKNEVVVEYETGAVKSLVMKVDGEKLLRSRLTQTGDREEASYEVPYGASLEITAYASEQYTLCYADITQGTQEPVRVETSETKYEGTLEITEDTRIQLTAAGKNNEIVKEVRADQSEVALTPMSGVYNLSWDSKYTISLLEGNTKLELTKAEARAVGAEVSVTIRESDQKVADLEIISGDEGRNIKFKVMLTGRLKTADGTYKEVSKVLNMILVTDSITSATIKSPAECIPDARNLYIVRFQAEAGTYSSAGRIGAEVIPEEGITEDDLTVEWKPSGRTSGNIIVQTGARIPYGKVATVKLYHIGALPTDEDYYVDGGEVEICVVKPSAWEKAAPEVSLISTDDVSLTLSLKGLDDRRRCINGVQYYRVAVTPKEKDGESIPDSILEATRNPFYIQREFPEYDEETEEVTESSNFKQTARLIVNSAAYGTGQEWEFDVKVSMVQSYDKTALNAANEAEMLLYRSLETGLDSTVATKDPSFATKVTVKKATTKIYTTQKQVVAASLKFDAKTTCADAGVEDITDCADNEKLIVTVEDGKVIMSASKDTRLGKHTLQIRPFAPSTLYCEAKTLSVTVQKGIESLSVSLPSDRLYKKPGKAGTLKADVIYNAGDVAPQTKKVTWSVVDTDGEPLWQGTDLEGQITVKNGKITVNRNLDVDEMDCQFCVKVTAADFKGNEISAISDVITATTQALEPGTPLIVQWQEETSQYVVVAKDGDSVTTDKLQNAKLVILRKGIEAAASYTEEDLAEVQMEAKQFSVKSSATKSVQLRNDGKDIWVLSGKPAKDIKLTVTANDGGKKTASMKFTIQYAEPEELRLQAEQEGALLNQVSAATENMEIPFYGTVNTKLTLRVMQGSKNADWAELYAYTNHSVKVSGGKILTSDAEKGIYTVVVTGEKATVTFKDGAKGVKKTYTLVNKAYSKTKAPGIKIKANTGKTITAGVLTGRTLEYTVDQKKYSCENKYVMLETHALSEVKKPSDYAKLTGACSTINTCVAVASDGTIKLAFNDSDIPLGSYKLTFTLGIKNESGQFIADAKPVSMTVKVVKPKVIKGSYKANTSYTVKTTAEGTIAKGTPIELTGTSKKLRSVTYTKLQGCNVGGQENKFLKYFALEDNKLILKEDLSKEQIQNGKDDFTGYITYVAEYGDNGYGMPYTTQRKTVKVTIKFK